MTALLRADWIRYRRRLDLWVIGIGALVFAGIGFLSGYRTDSTDPVWQTEAEIRRMVLDTSYFEGVSQDEIDRQVDQMVADYVAGQEAQKEDWERSQAINLQKYDLAQSPLTILGSGIVPLIAVFFTATLIVGDEFRHGTIRTSLLAASARRRFLAARLVTIAVMTVGLFLLVVALGFVLSLVLRILGAELPPSTVPLDIAAAAALVGAEVVGTFTVVALGVALVLLTRSGAVPLLLVVIYAVAEVFIANLAIFARDTPLAAVPNAFVTRSIQTLVAHLAQRSGALTFAQSGVAVGEGAADLWVASLIVLAWLGLFVVIADRRFRTMDIVE